MSETATNLVAWDGETYKGAGEWYELIGQDETLDLDADERLRLAVYLWANYSGDKTDINLTKWLELEQDAWRGEFMDDVEFTKDLLVETATLPADLPDWVVIDWQGTWDWALSYDYMNFDVIDMDGAHRRFYWASY